MKHRVFLIAVLFACMLGGVTASAEDARKIEQFIAKNIDGTISDFSLFYRNTTDSELRIDAFFTGRHYVDSAHASFIGGYAKNSWKAAG